MNDASEQKLLAACRKGDRKAQKAVYDKLAGKMLQVCMRYVGDRQTAEDLLQEGFVTLFTKMDSFKEEGAFEGWARKIFVNTALMYLRKKDALKVSDSIEAAYGLSSEGTTQTQELGYKELMKLIMSMPDGFRTVFNMYAIEGYSHKEIADSLDISESTSRTQFSRARMWLQEKIGKRKN